MKITSEVQPNSKSNICLYLKSWINTVNMWICIERKIYAELYFLYQDCSIHASAPGKMAWALRHFGYNSISASFFQGQSSIVHAELDQQALKVSQSRNLAF